MSYAAITGKKQKNAVNKVYFIVLVFIIIKLFALSSYKTIWWDSSVYIGMGKYIYSFGDAGLWENSRPIAWPLILGFFWKSGLDYVLIGRIAEIIFGSMCIFLTYLIGKEIFGGKIGLLAAFFLAISPTFFFFNGIMLTEIASTFFSLLAIYLFIDENYFFSGLLFGIAFMTKFLQFFVFIGIIFALVYNKKNIKNIFFGFFIAILPYLVINQILYHNPFFPFIEQIFLTGNSGWINHQPLSYYFIELFKENFLYLLFVVGIFLSFRKSGSRLIIFPLILAFLFFSLIKQKEMRFLIILMPYMHLLVSYGLFSFAKSKLLKKSIPVLMLLLFAFSAIKISIDLASESGKLNKYLVFQDLLEKSNGNIWISSPIISSESDKRIGKLIYYPVFGRDLKKLLKESENADFIFVDICDLGCKPSDSKCESSKKGMISFFRQKFAEIYSRQGECPQYAFKR